MISFFGLASEQNLYKRLVVNQWVLLP